MSATRAELLWTFQEYLDQCQVFDPERREKLSALFLSHELTRDIELEFSLWCKENKRARLRNHQPKKPRTRPAKLWTFEGWLRHTRPELAKEDRERFERLYMKRALSGPITAAFHRFVRSNQK